MDADNRVVLNCGGIRHEVYKVHNGKLMNLIYVCALDDYLVLNIKTFLRSERTIFFDLTNNKSCFNSGHSEENPRHSAVSADRGTRQL